MKFDLVSDCHIEIGGISELYWKPDAWKQGADTLVMAGDMTSIDFLKGKSAKSGLGRELFVELSKMYKDVIWVMGNHEFYHNMYNFNVQNAKDLMIKIGASNIKVLERESIEIEDAIFYGTTLWTDMDKGNPVTMNAIQSGMNDYAQIKMVDEYLEWRYLVPADTVTLHKMMRRGIEKFIETKSDKKKVLVTHHAPSYQSVPAEYRGHELNAAYASELFDVLYDSDIKVAVHGHMHEPADYMINNTRVTSNPRGYYGLEASAYNFSVKTIEV